MTIEEIIRQLQEFISKAETLTPQEVDSILACYEAACKKEEMSINSLKRGCRRGSKKKGDVD
jgi:hypothetical protein